MQVSNHKFTKSGLLILACLFLVQFHFAQEIKLEHYNDNNGLSHNSIRHIVQDKNGFLWFGTFAGLNRFDGYEFKTFTSNSEEGKYLNNDDITALELDNTNNILWIGTRKGLTRFEMDTYTFTTFLTQPDNPASLPDEEVRSVLVDSKGTVWVGTKTKGLYRFLADTDSFQKIELTGFNYVKEIFEDKNGNIWVGSYENVGIAKLRLDANGRVTQKQTFELEIPQTNQKNPYINFIYEDLKQNIFVGTRAGLYKLDTETDQFVNLYIQDETRRRSLGPYFLSVAQTQDGSYWVGTLGGLLECKNLEDIPNGDYTWYYSVLSDDTSLIDNLVSSLYLDDSGVLWIGTEDGLDKYDPFQNQFKISKDISKYIGNKAPRIRGFAKTANNQVVVATRHNGLFISDKGRFIPLYDQNEDIASIYSVDGNSFYCGLWNGKILHYNLATKKHKELDLGFGNFPIFAFQEISNAQLLVGSFGDGAKLLDLKTNTVVNANMHLVPGFKINALDKDEKGIVWMATETGIVRYVVDTGSIRTYKTKPQDGDKLVFEDNVGDVLVDNQNKVWIATRVGLSYFDAQTEQFVNVKEPKELVGKWITDLETDSMGNLWLNINNNNIARLNPQNKDLKTFQVNSGNRLDVFSSSGFLNVDGRNIYLAGKNGIVHFDTHHIKENQWSPRPFITDLRVKNKEVLPQQEINNQIPLKEDINLGETVHLTYDNRDFSVQFSTPSYTNPKLNRYQYKLEGFNEEWITVNSNSRTVQYTNLFPNTYTFKVRATNNFGVWSTPREYTIKISPPFWLTPQALALLLAIIAIATFLIRRELKHRSKLKADLLTEKVNREHDVKLNNEKLRFFTNISHELRTPLTLILGPSKQLLEHNEGATEYQKSRYNLIYQNASRLLNLVNQVLDFRKAQTGELKLKVAQTDVVLYTKHIFESFKELAFKKNITYNFIVEEEEIKGWIDSDKYDKIVYNLLSNALKFTEAYGTVDLFLRTKENNKNILVVEISDDGIGIPAKSLDKIFSRFYQATNNKDYNTGSGIGLSLVKSLIGLHKGDITVNSALGKGSSFVVELPIGRDSYTEDEVFEYVVTAKQDRPIEVLEITAKKAQNNTQVKQKILVVEDNVELRKYLVDYLSDFYKVYMAENGEEGLDLCKKIKPILCIADVMMPVMTGIEFCKALKQDEDISHIPVILLTALSENEDKVKGYGAGADGYIVKPFEPALLRTVVDNMIKNRLELKAKFSEEVESEVSLLTHSPIDEEFMQKVTQIIMDQMGNSELTTTYLCKEMGVSSSKLYRKIKELTDLSPNEFIRTVRLKKSAQLLKSRKYNVSEVAYTTGFKDPLYFSRCFKKQFGFPPSKLLN
ncbi:hybrid sensor histidine kinase/response regulator transcription factor [Croceivirga radicis]|uniref:hybrid sensor histidine kinase/response regulator transcription factor n=1 Tax=Croceivirga radicis TaxID=1929488 RepID=UPI000255ABF8|nr:hybrid sensor histidine kinase/response regulator transcription factor [Croceivirga radicis]